MCFHPFDSNIKLTEVIAGPLCAEKKTRIAELTKNLPGKIEIIKARLAFRSFSVVRNKKGFR